MNNILTSDEFEKLYKIMKDTLVEKCRIPDYEILPIDLLVGEMIKTIRELEENKMIEIAKQEYLKLSVTLYDVYYDSGAEYIYFLVRDSEGNEDEYGFERYDFKCLDDILDEDLKGVSLLGSRAIQWKKLNIQIGVQELLEGIQVINNWKKGLKK